MPRMATTSALSRTASKNAVAVISTISRKVGIGPKELKMINRAAGERDGVEDDDAGGAQAFARVTA